MLNEIKAEKIGNNLLGYYKINKVFYSVEKDINDNWFHMHLLIDSFNITKKEIAKNLGQSLDANLGARRIGRNQLRDGIEAVEKKMRIDLCAQRTQLGGRSQSARFARTPSIKQDLPPALVEAHNDQQDHRDDGQEKEYRRCGTQLRRRHRQIDIITCIGIEDRRGPLNESRDICHQK